MKISMIGHSSVLIEFGGMRILTDPWFGNGNIVYARVNPPACAKEDVADVDLVLVSHNHFDHADSSYLRLLPAATPVVAPSGTAWVTRRKGARNVVGMAPWQQQAFGRVVVTAVPALHSPSHTDTCWSRMAPPLTLPPTLITGASWSGLRGSISQTWS